MEEAAGGVITHPSAVLATDLKRGDEVKDFTAPAKLR